MTKSYFFYQESLFVLELLSSGAKRIVWAGTFPLGEQQADATLCFAVDGSNTVLEAGGRHYAYTPFGGAPLEPDKLTIDFTGAPWREMLGGYLLGNGYRCYKPALMRFCSPDRLSPFKEGGFNAYCYCGNNPVSYVDPSGASFFSVMKSNIEMFFTSPKTLLHAHRSLDSPTFFSRFSDLHHGMVEQVFNVIQDPSRRNVSSVGGNLLSNSISFPSAASNRIVEHATLNLLDAISSGRRSSTGIFPQDLDRLPRFRSATNRIPYKFHSPELSHMARGDREWGRDGQKVDIMWHKPVVVQRSSFLRGESAALHSNDFFRVNEDGRLVRR
ncbi:RHS repeat-associated core domain-containing protein [Pseudomonas sp. SWRI51]|uniref:RHS repeat-associated core domain-containing protein n=1 Tax=Pseudomonas sp. SWRI51 TaxID=2745491 RepID=UPI001644FE24|nr:RHS repeat-associated core domain-containing protein [Pseudomonas sp. SWRI51]MBC3412962.1 RHS repeat-associated core domain-containing protein [Pseudomonas sp. SWRI51]